MLLNTFSFFSFSSISGVFIFLGEFFGIHKSLLHFFCHNIFIKCFLRKGKAKTSAFNVLPNQLNSFPSGASSDKASSKLPFYLHARFCLLFVVIC